ncbi:MAG: ATP-binding cassette domain-containing protein [Bacteriovoracaceae bacterium]
MKMITFRKEEEALRSGNMRFRDQIKIMAKPELGFIKAIIINTLAMSLLGLAVPIAIQSIINNIGVRTLIQPIVVMSLMLLFILGFSNVLQVIQTYTIEILRRRLFIRYGFVVMERLERYVTENYRKINSSALINRYFDIVIMQSSMVNFFVEGAAFIIMFVIGFTLLGFYHPYFLLFGLFMVAFLVVDWLIFGLDGIAAGSPEADGKYKAEEWMEQVGHSRHLFLSKGARAFSSSKLTKLMNDWLVVRNDLFTFQFRQHIGLQIFSSLVNVLLVFLGSILVLRGQLSVGQLVAAALVLSNIVANVGRLQSFFTSVYDYSTSLDKIAEFYDHPLEDDTSILLPDNYHIKFDQVKLSPNYHFNFEFSEGTKNYILIKSFSAKNKLMEFCYGLTNPDSGKILLGGKLLDDLDKAGFRDQFLIIDQDHFFHGTVAENLVGFLPEGLRPSLTEIDAALEKVGLDELIRAMPEGINTMILPHGHPLSKSQLLALQVAKAILLKPRIVIVTTDFEHISTEKRMKCLKVLTDKSSSWTLLFFSQKNQKDKFDHYYALSRDKLKTFPTKDELLKELAQDE